MYVLGRIPWLRGWRDAELLIRAEENDPEVAFALRKLMEEVLNVVYCVQQLETIVEVELVVREATQKHRVSVD